MTLTAVAVGLVLLCHFNPARTVWAPKCPFKLLTGLSCGGCGGQRAVYALMHGRLREAMAYNYYLVIAGPYFLLLVINHYLLPPSRLTSRVTAALESRTAMWLYIISFITWMTVRNILNI